MRIKISSLVIVSALLALTALGLNAASQQSWALSYGVGSYGTDGKTTDDQFYGSGDDSPVAIAKMPDGGYFVAGQLDLPKLYNNV